ncbi:hypothetical protein Dimus_006445 [Dionaea muscipula]
MADDDFDMPGGEEFDEKPEEIEEGVEEEVENEDEIMVDGDEKEKQRQEPKQRASMTNMNAGETDPLEVGHTPSQCACAERYAHLKECYDLARKRECYDLARKRPRPKLVLPPPKFSNYEARDLLRNELPSHDHVNESTEGLHSDNEGDTLDGNAE